MAQQRGEGGEGRGRGKLSLVERHCHARLHWLIYWLLEPHAVHIYIFSSRLLECGTEILAQISSPVDACMEIFTGFPSSLCKALFRCGTCRHDLIGAGDKGSVNSPACEYDISLLPGAVCGGGLFSTFTWKPWKIVVCKWVSGVWSTQACFCAAMYFLEYWDYTWITGLLISCFIL